MSLSSQIKDKNSPARKFFMQFQKKDGTKSCLALLQSTKPIWPLSFIPSSTVVHTYIGTTTDYLIRYAGNGNVLPFESTIASEALARAALLGAPADHETIKHLFKIGKQNLDGRDASDYTAIYSATALTIMDGFFRSGRLPKLFLEAIQKHGGRILKEKTTNDLFGKYFASLGGDKYAQDISGLIQLFLKVCKDPRSELFEAKIVAGNQALNNSWLVEGADFDCVFESASRLILTDIKTTIKPLTIEHLRQIIGYALLYDEEKDDFKFTDIGIYHSRSGSFRSLPIDSVIEMTLVGFKSVGPARKAFIAALKKANIMIERNEPKAAPIAR